MTDHLTLDKSMTESELLKLRAQYAHRMNEAWIGEIPKCTCSGCPREKICAVSWDLYNVDGACKYDTLRK